jgi:hypothetical protein
MARLRFGPHEYGGTGFLQFHGEECVATPRIADPRKKHQYRRRATSHGRGATPAAVQEFVNEQQANVMLRRREGIKLGGLILLGSGVGIEIFLADAPGPTPIHLMGTIPFMIGLAMLSYVYFMSPKVG